MGMYSVLVTEPGPLYVRLKYDDAQGVFRVNGWDPTPHGGPGPIEAQELVRLGDALVSINKTSLKQLGEEAAISEIQMASVPRDLVFESSHVGGKLTKTLHSGGLVSNSNRSWPYASENTIDEHRLRSLVSSGILRKEPARPVVWRVLLKYLPFDVSKWTEHLETSRELYSHFLREFSTDSVSRAACTRSLAQHARPSFESPLVWSHMHTDNALKEEISKDVVRTRPDLHSLVKGVAHESMKRVLFIYAKLNPGIRYVQGMNEVVGTLLYVFVNDSDEHWSSHAEADAFFCFTNLMAEMRDVYIDSLDHSANGLRSRMMELEIRLQRCDQELWCHLTKHQLDPSYYSLRWITTLLSREFPLSDTINLWDAIFAEVSRSDFICNLCVAMLLNQRVPLLAGDFAVCLKLLQNYPSCDLEVLIRTARALEISRSEVPLKGTDIVSSLLKGLTYASARVGSWFKT